MGSDEMRRRRSLRCVLQLVHDNFTFMDRHWKKMIKDLYQGTLHSAVPVSAATRMEYLEEITPQRKAAIAVETVLMRCGLCDCLRPLPPRDPCPLRSAAPRPPRLQRARERAGRHPAELPWPPRRHPLRPAP